MQEDRYCVIMAGGIGSRFWPISKSSQPKQFLDILGTGKSFIRHTYDRFSPIIPAENFLVVTNTSYKSLVLQHLPELKEDQVLCEPLGRNTAPCIAYAAYKLMAKNPNASMVVTPADHLVLNESEFVNVIREGFEFAEEHDSLVTIGIKPNRPDTGYGYIQIDTNNKDKSLNKVKTFTEKPTLEVAKAFVESGEFFWNSGIFLWKGSEIIKSFEQYLPELSNQFSSLAEDYNTPRESEAINRIYPECRNISIDYGVMEKASNVYVRCSEFGWSDIGTWGSLYTHSNKDENGNVVTGDVILYNTKDSIVSAPSERLIVVKGLDGFIVVESDQSLLICPKADEQSIRQFVEDVKLKKGSDYI